VGTSYTNTIPQFADGKLLACVVDFGTLEHDWAYRQGRVISVSGSFGIMGTQDKLAVTLKVIVHDIDFPAGR
jgi:hypothetical protein